MTDEQIIKALERCFIVGSCSGCAGCPLKPKRQEDANCIDKLVTNTIDLIKRQQAEIDRLQKAIKDRDEADRIAIEAYEQLLYENDYQKAEIKRLTMANSMNMSVQVDDKTMEDLIKQMKTQKIICIDNTKSIRAETIKEFAEKLKDRKTSYYDDDGWLEEYVRLETIDNLVKEMVGDE